MSGGFNTVTAMNQKDKNLEKSIFVHFDMIFLTTLTGIFDFANWIFQTGKKICSIFQNGGWEKSSADR